MTHQVEDHPGPRFAPIGVLSIGDDTAVRVERAIARIVNARALRRKLLSHPAIQIVHGLFAEKPACHA